mmetsp:Transcript_27500/g.53817  ORF Transcript_27500/g.53817 Transcript_27500/m.53817 type:complete len:522 (+) Transcript_27500:80-1645(+)|eukprot:CAMPEP_0172721458 /NCGR_PEP_ID=MMETSP1074-20121228/79145_1 /TAXON_ID=2916 /ORGANISM="Ceratium fusus, Strain PA161109" /LENGTH=521 /DNA_ID=CAMNT_0013547209 /DNA_START=81 /DNA_END=1646 /DNA_ORIENTATION=+
MAPKGSKSGGLEGIVKVVVDTFIEQDDFRKLHRTLSEQWSNCHSLTAAVRLMEAHGVKISPEEENQLQQLPEERMIDSLVTKMPQQSREQFEHFFLQLSFIASTTTRLRSALEGGQPGVIEEALESAENVGVLPYVIKMAVAQAGQEVKNCEAEQQSWANETGTKLGPMLQAQANSMTTQKALNQARADVSAISGSTKEKSKNVLLGMASNAEETLKATTFLGWSDTTKRLKRENEIRKDYEQEIDEATKKLMDYKAAQLANVRGVLNRTAKESTASLVASVIGVLKTEAQTIKHKREGRKELAKYDEDLEKFAQSSASNAKKVMGRMSAGSDEGLVSMAFKGWMMFVEDYKRDKEMNDAIKSQEQKTAAFMQKQKDGAQAVLGRMTQASATGTMASVFKEWVEIVITAKNAEEIGAVMKSNNSRMKSFKDKTKGSAKSVSQRVAWLQEQMIFLAIFSLWKREWKYERLKRYAQEKNMRRKQELIGVKGLFKNFASELETSLKEGTPRDKKKRSGSTVPAA